jgi:glycerophosphoryl diester phosphodiesterase
MSSRPVFAVAHRGASAYAPENTVAAFDEAVRLGARAVEFDLRVSADGIPVVIHDPTVDRTTSGTGRVADLDLLDLRRFDAGSWLHRRFAGIRIPTLEEALLAIGPYAMPVIELKVPPPPSLIDILRKFDLEQDALVLSFDRSWLAAVRKSSKEVPLGLLAESWSYELPEATRRLDAGVLGLGVEAVGPSQVAMAEGFGLELWCFTANDVGMVAACAAMGVTGIITDRPDLIRTREAAR